MSNKPTFTVFTPTYNRVGPLTRVFASLAVQTFRDFEWVIVDDGSTDGTEAQVREWIEQADFPIRYFWQRNGHKKAAFNRGVREARGTLFLCADSDDAYPPDALQIFVHQWCNIPESERQRFTGVCGLCVDEQGRLIGDKFPEDVFDSDSLELRYRRRVRGEKWGFNRTDVLRDHPFPDMLPGYVPEGVIWSRIARSYRTRFVNRVVRVYFSTEDSITVTGTSLKQKRANAFGQAYWAREILCNQLRWFRFSPGWFVKAAANYTRFKLHLSVSAAETLSHLNLDGVTPRILVIALWPIGVLRFAVDHFGSIRLRSQPRPETAGAGVSAVRNRDVRPLRGRGGS